MNLTGDLNIIVPLCVGILTAGALVLKFVPRARNGNYMAEDDLKECIKTIKDQVHKIVTAVEVMGERVINNKSAIKAAHERIDRLLEKLKIK